MIYPPLRLSRGIARQDDGSEVNGIKHRFLHAEDHPCRDTELIAVVEGFFLPTHLGRTAVLTKRSNKRLRPAEHATAVVSRRAAIRGANDVGKVRPFVNNHVVIHKHRTRNERVVFNIPALQLRAQHIPQVALRRSIPAKLVNLIRVQEADIVILAGDLDGADALTATGNGGLGNRNGFVEVSELDRVGRGSGKRSLRRVVVADDEPPGSGGRGRVETRVFAIRNGRITGHLVSSNGFHALDPPVLESHASLFADGPRNALLRHFARRTDGMTKLVDKNGIRVVHHRFFLTLKRGAFRAAASAQESAKTKSDLVASVLLSFGLD